MQERDVIHVSLPVDIAIRDTDRQRERGTSDIVRPDQSFSPHTFGDEILRPRPAFGATACFANAASLACSSFTFSGCLSARFVFSYGSSFRLNSSTLLRFRFLRDRRPGRPRRRFTTSFQSPARIAPPFGVVLSRIVLVRRRLALGDRRPGVRPSSGSFCSSLRPGELQQRRIPVDDVQRLGRPSLPGLDLAVPGGERRRRGRRPRTACPCRRGACRCRSRRPAAGRRCRC